MLDLRSLRQNPQAAKTLLKIKGYDFDTLRFEELETQRKSLQSLTEELRNERNVKSKSIGKAKAAGEDIAPLVAEVGDLGERLDAVESKFHRLQEEYQAFAQSVPNLPDASVPAGSDEADNVEVDRWGALPEFNFEPKDHVDLGAGGMLDFEAATKIAGSRFVVMHGAVARLHRAPGLGIAQRRAAPPGLCGPALLDGRRVGLSGGASRDRCAYGARRLPARRGGRGRGGGTSTGGRRGGLFYAGHRWPGPGIRVWHRNPGNWWPEHTAGA